MLVENRILVHVDMNAFFASAEAVRHPEWKNTPIIVCVFSGRTDSSGVVSSATYDARKMGIKASMPIVHAQQLCPNGHFVKVDHEYYSQLSDAVFTRLYAYADQLELASIDEAYAELTQKANGDFNQAALLMKKFQTEIQTDFHLSCSVGIGPNKLVSKIASDFQKPNGFTLVERPNVQSFLDPLSVKQLVGVGPKTQEELKKKGVETVLELRCTPLSELVKVFGGAKGQSLFFYSRGMDDSPIEPNRERKQHSKIWTLKLDAEAWEDVKESVSGFAEELWNETAGKGLFFTQIGVIGISSTLQQASKSKTATLPFSTREIFLQGLGELFVELFDSNAGPWRRIGIRVSGFSSPPKQKRLGDFLS